MMNANERASKFNTHHQPDADWLALAPAETILDPELPIVDTHHHLGEVKGAVNKILEGDSLRYLLEDYAADAATGHRVVASVYVEGYAMWRRRGPKSLRPVGEIEFANGVAAMSASGQYGPTRVASAIVGHVDLTQGDATVEALEASVAAGNGRLRGIRHSGHWSADPGARSGKDSGGEGLYRRPEFVAGARKVAALGLGIEAWVFFTQLADVCCLADALPNDRIVLNHMGGPLGVGRHAERPDEVYAAWRAAMSELALRDNVVVKISGLTNRLRNYMGRDLPPDSVELAADWRRYIESTVELFCVDRCMFASSFPVDKQGATWVAHWNAYKRVMGGASADEKQRAFCGTAARVYGIDLDAP